MCCSVLQCVVECVDTTMQSCVSQLSSVGCANSESTVESTVESSCGNMWQYVLVNNKWQYVLSQQYVVMLVN